MYKLVRVDNEIKLIKSESGLESALVTLRPPGSQNLNRIWAQCAPHERKAWEEFVKTGRVKSEPVSPAILESWNRCLKAEVNHRGGRCWDVLSKRQLEKRRNQLVELSEPVMETLHSCMRGFGFVVVLTDHEGYILKSIGDLSAMRRGDKINFVPGANWSELSVGTNAIGTALAIGSPIQVTGAEHYNDGHHLWTCAATPILDTDGRVIACLDISGPRENASFNIMEMTSAAARFIEERLRLDQAHNFLLRANQYMSAAFNSVSDGLISLDARGLINGVNLAAARLLGRTPRELIGCPAEEAIPVKWNAGESEIQQQVTREVLDLKTASGKLSCQVMTQSFRDGQGDPNGALITVSQIKSPARLAATHLNHLGIRYKFEDIIGESPALLKVVERARLTAPGSSTILILGESGTGKEVFAQAIHQASSRRNASFISINCGAMPRELIQSELFGYSDGAFTGARRGGRRGKLELANGGTLFLDEIADIPLDIQVNLLRVLEDKAIHRLGDEKITTTDVRIIAATNKNLYEEVQAGRFRQDLYYRLNVVVIEIPPLQDRGDDIRLLTEYHLEQLAVKLGKPVRRVSPEVFAALAGYHWPGNIRELINILEQAVNFMPGDELTTEHLPAHINSAPKAQNFSADDEIKPLWIVEKTAIEHALRQCEGNISKVARSLGIGRNTLYDKMKKYGVPVPKRRSTAVR